MAPNPPDARSAPAKPGRSSDYSSDYSDIDTFHLVAHQPPTQAEVLATISERLRVSGLSLVERLDRPTTLERRVARMLQGYRQYLTQHLVFDDHHARRVLPPEILQRATLSRTTLHTLIDLALTIEDRLARIRLLVPTRGSS